MPYNTQHRQQMYMYNQLNLMFNRNEKSESSRDSLGNLLSVQGKYCTKPRGITLMESTQIRGLLR
jgi:hypothetical protein